MNYLRYYDLEAYFFDHVTRVFERRGHLTGFEFFSIVRCKWPAACERQDTKISRRRCSF
jgi:hypothetical protein